MADGPQVVILAAGEGTRMRSARPKVLHTVAGISMIDHALRLAKAVTQRPPEVVISPRHQAVREAIAARANPVEQAQPLGTGDALRSVPASQRSDGPVLVVYADTPLLSERTVGALLDRRDHLNSACVLLAATPPDPGALGRLSRSSDGRVTRITELLDLKDGDDNQNEVNVGAYAFRGSDLWPALDKLSSDNAKSEFYLTDVVELLGGADTVTLEDLEEAIGVNDRVQLARAEAVMRRRVLHDLMLSGVTVVDPETTYVDAGIEVGPDSIIHPLTFLRGTTHLGSNCEIGPGAQLTNVVGRDRLVIGASVLEDCTLGHDVSIGHFDRVRPNSRLENGVSLGTHAEIKNSTIGAGSRINHFACVLDSDVGVDVNVGAGTVTCNFDGSAKHRTVIGDRVFVGTNATLIAPLTLDDDSYIAAGSVISMDVPSGALGVGRARQRNVNGWMQRRPTVGGPL